MTRVDAFIEGAAQAYRECGMGYSLPHRFAIEAGIEAALAAAAEGGDVKQAPGEAPQSGPKGNAQ